MVVMIEGCGLLDRGRLALDLAADSAAVAALLGRPVTDAFLLAVFLILVVVSAIALDDFGGHGGLVF